jgi:hypothetical protein
MSKRSLFCFAWCLFIVLIYCNYSFTFAQENTASATTETEIGQTKQLEALVQNLPNISEVPLECKTMPVSKGNDRLYCFFGPNTVKNFQSGAVDGELAKVHDAINKNLANLPALSLVIFMDRDIFDKMNAIESQGTSMEELGTIAFETSILDEEQTIQSMQKDLAERVANGSISVEDEKRIASQGVANIQGIESDYSYQVVGAIIQKEFGKTLGSALGGRHSSTGTIFSRSLTDLDNEGFDPVSVMVHESAHALDFFLPTASSPSLSLSPELPFLPVAQDKKLANYLQDLAGDLQVKDLSKSNTDADIYNLRHLIELGYIADPKEQDSAIDAHAIMPTEVFAFSSQLWFAGYTDAKAIGELELSQLKQYMATRKSEVTDVNDPSIASDEDSYSFMSKVLSLCSFDSGNPMFGIQQNLDFCEETRSANWLNELITFASLANMQAQIRQSLANSPLAPITQPTL